MIQQPLPLVPGTDTARLARRTLSYSSYAQLTDSAHCGDIRSSRTPRTDRPFPPRGRWVLASRAPRADALSPATPLEWVPRPIESLAPVPPSGCTLGVRAEVVLIPAPYVIVRQVSWLALLHHSSRKGARLLHAGEAVIPDEGGALRPLGPERPVALPAPVIRPPAQRATTLL